MKTIAKNKNKQTPSRSVRAHQGPPNMEALLYNNVKKLYDDELYDCVIPAASLLLTVMKNDRTMATPEVEYHVMQFYAHSYFQTRQYRVASQHLETALVMRKSLARHKNTKLGPIEHAYPTFNEVNTRYALAYCHRELGDHVLAVQTLQALSLKVRTPKVNMLLAKLLHYGSSANLPESIRAYKEVLRENPFALEVVGALLELGVDGSDVNGCIVNASPNSKNIEWLVTWIKGQAQMYGRKHLEASKTFQGLNDNSKFRQNEYLLTMIGRCLYYYGSFSQAQQYLEMAVMHSPYLMDAVVPLAVVYEYNQKQAELDKLSNSMSNIHEFQSEHWFVLAQSFYAAGKMEKASSFTHKAVSVSIRNVEAQLLRGKICLQTKRHKEGIYFFRAAQCIANYRFEVYKGLFHCYVGMKRIKEAQTMCALAVKYFRNSPRSYVMFARTLYHSSNPLAKKNAKKFVTKALDIDEHFAPAVALLAEICQSEGKPQEAIAMLKKQVVRYPHHKLFTMLGDILSGEKDLGAALEYYTVALSMEPGYQRALDGVNALGQARANKPDQDTSMSTTGGHDEEWPIDCDEPSIEAVELSSPAIPNDVSDTDTFSDPFWQDVDADITN